MKNKSWIDSRNVVRVLLATGLCAGTPAFGTLVTTTSDGTTLANTILGSGVTLVGTPTFTGAAGSAGTFTGGNSVPLGVGFNSGIVLTSGDALIAQDGVNNLSNSGRDNGTGGNAQLSALSGGATYDAASLTFSFSISDTAPGNLFFNFVFASEEYNEYVGSQYNDVFGFFLDGVNIALLPGGAPVSINNVNAGSNPALYRNNSPGSLNTEYDGLTTVLTASALGLAAGTHTITLAIADTSDHFWDSAVFIQGGTFSTEMTPVPEPTTIVAGALLLLPFGVSTFRFIRKNRMA